MNGSPHQIRLTSPAEVAGFVPYLLGFHPTGSLVVLVRRHQVLFALAAALPDSLDGRGFRTTAAYIADRLTQQHVTQAVLIGYGAAEPVRVAVEHCTAALAQAGIQARDALRVDDGRIWHLHCADPGCPTDGAAFDPATTVAAASATAAGLVALADRAAVTDQLAPPDGPTSAVIAAATASAVSYLDQLVTAAGDESAAAQRLVDTVRRLTGEAITAYRTGQTLTDGRAALLTVLLNLPTVRGAAARLVRGDDAQIRLWIDLTRRAHPTFVPGPAPLLALAALQAGNGALARDALQRALDSDPDDQLTQLLYEAVQLGIDPATAAALVTD